MTDNEDDAPDPARLMKLARQAMSSAQYRKKFHLADFWGPAQFYEPQMRFFLEGAHHHQRLIYGGNQVGKSFAAAYETSLHLSGQYPKWWRGRRFDKPIRCWVVGPERTLVRDGPQRQLTARGGEFGSGTIPLAAFTGKPVMVPGGTQMVDTMTVAHETNGVRDGVSSVTFKSFEQGAEKMQSESVDVIWIDERCSEDIYSELLARTTATNGILYLSYTPLKGGGALTYKFLHEYSADRCDIRIAGKDATHIDPARREALAEGYQEHEKETRLEGIPQLGIARVFPYPVADMMRSINPDRDVEIWARWIVGLDPGFDHPAAAVLCAWVPGMDKFYVIDAFKARGLEVFRQVQRIAAMCRGVRIPIIGPHDANQHEKGSGEALYEVYRRMGAPMLHGHAVNHGTANNAVDPAIAEMCEFMKAGKFVLANHLSELVEEMLNYHRDENYKIVKLKDDLVSAMRYAFMTRRRGKPLDECESYGRDPGAHDPGLYDPRPSPPDRGGPSRFAKGTAAREPFDLFTGK